MASQSATREGALNARQVRFVEEYLVDFNATQAAIRAGYSKRTASEQGYDLLRKPQIAEAIQAKQRELSAKTGITVERVVQELARLAFSDIRKLYREDGSLKNPTELDDEAAAALAGVDVVELAGAMKVGGEDGGQHAAMYVKKVKLWDKKGALETLLKHLGAEGGKPPADPGAALAALPSAVEALTAKLEKLVPLKEAA